MSYFTTDCYEMKREIILFSKKISEGLSKPKSKFVADVLFGLASSQSCLLSNIARSLCEDINLNNVIDRLSDQLKNFSEEDMLLIKHNFNKLVLKYLPDEPVINLDDSEIVKPYASRLENLDMVLDASSVNKKDVKPGYHVCEASVITKNEAHPISVYSRIYSTKSKEFVSKNEETLKSIEYVKSFLPERCTFVMDRGYDSGVIFDYFLNKNEGRDDFIIRIKENRHLLFKKKAKKVGEIAKQRKGKIHMNMYFKTESKEAYVSHTRTALPSHADKELTLVIVYGLREENPMMLLTNKKVKNKNDVHKIVRNYIKRWRIEEGFRFKKQGYGFEKMLLKRMHSMQVMNEILMMHIGKICMLVEEMDKKLLVIKIIERSRSVKKKTYLWFYQMSRGMREMLRYAHQGIKEYQHIRKKAGFKQLSLQI